MIRKKKFSNVYRTFQKKDNNCKTDGEARGGNKPCQKFDLGVVSRNQIIKGK